MTDATAFHESIPHPAGLAGERRGGSGPAPEPLYALRLRALGSWFIRQPPSFWLVCIYVMFEYVRPQSIYPLLNLVPWSKILLVLAPLMFLVERNRLVARTPINIAMIVFSAILLLSCFFAYRPDLAFDELTLYINWVLAYILIANVVNTERRFLFFMAAFLLYSFKLSQHSTRIWIQRGLGFTEWGVMGPDGWFHNSGELGIQMCVFFPLSLYFVLALRKHWGWLKTALFVAMPVTAAAAIIASSSRGALLGLAGVALWMLLRSRYKVRGSVAIAVFAFVVIFLVPPEQKSRFEEAGEDETSVTRLAYWEDGLDIAKNNPLFGVGYRNWMPYYRSMYPTTSVGQHQLPHNLFIEAMAELGYSGFLALLALLLAHAVTNYRTRKLMAPLGEQGRFLSLMAHGLDGALIGYLVSGFFVTVLFYPYLWFNLAMTAALHVAATRKAAEMKTSAPVPAAAPPTRRRPGVVHPHLVYSSRRRP